VSRAFEAERAERAHRFGGEGATAVGRQLGMSCFTCDHVTYRFAARDPAGLAPEERSGMPKIIDDAATIPAATSKSPTKKLAETTNASGPCTNLLAPN
jgi:hypothetical protein